MRKKIAAVALVGALGLTGGAVLGPAVASAQSADPGSGRLSALRDVLGSLVTDGTLTKAQADKVAAHLDSQLPMRGPGHHGGPGMRGGMGGLMLGPDVVARALGVTVEQLHEARHDGKTLTEIATSKGISTSTLISRLVAAAQDELSDAVADGRLTQAQADARKARLQERIAAMVDHAGKSMGRGMHGGMGGRMGGGAS